MKSKPKTKGTFYIFIPLLIYFIIQFISPFIVTYIIVFKELDVLLAIFEKQGADGIMSYAEVLINDSMYLMLGTTALLTIIVGAIMFLCKERREHDKLYINKLKLKNILLAIGLGSAFFLVTNIILTIIFSITLPNEVSSGYNSTTQMLFSDNILLGVLILGILIPISEELIFRGLCFNRMKEISPTSVSIISSSFMFALMHFGSFTQIIYTFALGYLLAYSYNKFENIIIPIVINVSFSLMNFVFYIPGLNDLLNNTIGLLAYYFIAVAVATITFKAIKRKPKVLLQNAQNEAQNEQANIDSL